MHWFSMRFVLKKKLSNPTPDRHAPKGWQQRRSYVFFFAFFRSRGEGGGQGGKYIRSSGGKCNKYIPFGSIILFIYLNILYKVVIVGQQTACSEINKN